LPASAFLQTNFAEAPGSTTTAKAANSNSNAPTAAITGSGTTDYIPLWRSSSALGNSILYQTGGNIGVATKTPGAKLDTVGTVIAVRGTTPGATGTGVAGVATSTTGLNFGVQGQTSSTTTDAAGVSGYEGATTGHVYGVFGQANSTTTNAMGVSGYEAATKGQVYGVDGYTASTGPFAAAVGGFEGATTGQVFGVTGGASSTTNGSAGVNGNESATTGAVYGVSGSTNSTTNFAAGVTGFEGAATGQVFGVAGGTSSSTNGAVGVVGNATATAGQVAGVSGNSVSTSGTGVFGSATAKTGATFGVFGQTTSPSGHGTSGYASATSGPAIGVVGLTNSPAGAGASFTNLGGGTSAVIIASGAGYANVFTLDASGNLSIKGKLTKGSGSFKIDHPLDPANRYLSHSFVESPDMMNVYNGNITTDKHGLATVVLPNYFEALNRDFRYQLTVIGQFAQAIVKQEIENNRFTIKTNKPSVKVSWQVTGIRHDAYADAYRIPVEENKPSLEQGHFLHPELFGGSEQQAIGAGLPTPSTADSPTRASLVSPLSEADAPVK